MMELDSMIHGLVADGGAAPEYYAPLNQKLRHQGSVVIAH